jgi:hypothetical protein
MSDDQNLDGDAYQEPSSESEPPPLLLTNWTTPWRHERARLEAEIRAELEAELDAEYAAAAPTPTADAMRTLANLLTSQAAANAAQLNTLATTVAAMEAAAPPPVAHTITVTSIGQQTVGVAFAVSGTISGYVSAVPTLEYQDGATGAWTAVPASGVTATTFTFPHPAIATASSAMQISVRDAANPTVIGKSNAFVVAVPAPSSDVNALTTTSGGSILMHDGKTLTITSAGHIQSNGVDVPGGDGSAQTAYVDSQIWGQDHASGTWYTYSGSGSSWIRQPNAPPNLVYPPTPAPPVTGGYYTVTASGGFLDPNGKPWHMRGLNGSPQDCSACGLTLLSQFGRSTALRLNCGNYANGYWDTDADIDKIVKMYGAKGVVVMIEDHSGNQSRTDWYAHMATIYKTNPYVFLETPNEPSANAATTAQNQIAIINAIRNAGFPGPIGIQPVGGYDGGNLATVVQACGTHQLFCTPHIYYYGTDPNYAAGKVTSWIDNNKNQLGLWSCVDEFGNDAGDGYSLAPQGNTVIDAVISAEQANRCGAVFWAMGNGYHDLVDSAFAVPDGSRLTTLGTQRIKPWVG